jgi:hypothetical protein
MLYIGEFVLALVDGNYKLLCFNMYYYLFAHVFGCWNIVLFPHVVVFVVVFFCFDRIFHNSITFRREIYYAVMFAVVPTLE